MRYNPVNELFSCYDNTQDKVFLYRYTMVPSYNIEIGESGWRSIVSAHNVLLPEGLTAYIVTGCTDNNLTLTKVTSIVKNTPVLLQGEAGTYTLTIIDDAEFSLVDTPNVSNSYYYMRIKLLQKIPPERISFRIMQELGVNGSIQGPRTMPANLA